jgi:HNH endonuclease
MANGRELEQFTAIDGEVYVYLAHPQRGLEKRMVAEMVLESFTGPKPSRKHRPVHLNGDKQDNRAANLAWHAFGTDAR